ncbi:hypothetical protein F5144DRAFT_633030 [Chaetomium tenue]|uniref:Uncharacterized protein n=1 Tax=Chaetomium tenue TaxID=1854479 RepID=A0ACB7NZH1_9PEZI|nr:hypothetical protein F5144DRAFT_633030 [Chaetomium globosum]
MGKTQLAIAYMKRHRNDHPASIWLNKTSLNQSFRGAAVRILHEHPDLSYMQAAVSDKDGDASLAVRRWLDEPTNGRWLLIYDNHDHPKMGGDTVEAPVGDSISGSSGRHGEADQPEPEGYDIRPYLPDTDHGAVILTTRSSTAQIGELLRLEKLRKTEDSLRILETTSGRTGIQDDAAAVALARKLDGLPLTVSTAGTYVTQVSTSWGQYFQDYESAWGQSQKLSPQLLTSENRAMYSTWNISFASIRRQGEPAAMLLRLWAFFGNEDLWYELLRRGGETQNDGESAEVPGALGRLYANQGRYKEAEAMFDRALEGKEKAWGPDHTSTLSAIYNLGLLYRNQGRYKEAEAMYKRALKGEEMAWGPEHMSTLSTVDNLGSIYKDQGRYNEAEAMLERALESKEKVCGPEHISTLTTVNNLAILYVGQGRYREAEALYQRALEGYGKVQGPEHISMAKIFNNLGNLYAKQGRYEEAEALLKQALERNEEVWGPEHESTLSTVSNLCHVYIYQQRYTEAEALYDRALEGYEEVLGLDHPSTLITFGRLADLYGKQKRYEDAEVIYKRVLEGQEKLYGVGHISTLAAVHNLGNLYLKQGRPEAEAMIKRALEGMEKGDLRRP